MQLAQSVQVSGLSLFGPEPIRALHLSTDTNFAVTTLYGLNGAGKTRILDAMRFVLSGIATDDRAFAHLRFSPEWLGWSERLFVDICDLAERQLGRTNVATRLPMRAGQEQEAAWASRFNQLRTDLRDFAVRHEAFVSVTREELGLTVEAVGTPQHPAWDVFVSTAISTGSPAAVHLRGLRDPGERAIEPPWTADVAEQFEKRMRESGLVSPEWAVLDQQLHNRRSPTGRPDWVPFRIGHLGRLDIREERIAIIDAAAKLEDVELESWELVSAHSPDPAKWPSDEQERVINDLGHDASNYASALFGGDIRLVYRVSEANSQGGRPTLKWFWTNEYDNEIPLNVISSGEKLIAGTAISAAVGINGRDVTAIVFLDEPERSLHPRAIERVAQGLTELMFTESTTATSLYSLVVATHAPALVNPDCAHVVHVDRHPDGEVRVNELQLADWSEPKRLARELGWTTADLLQKIRKWVIVEGQHDLAVIGALFDDELAARGWALAPMQGARQISSVLTSRFLLDYSDATIRVVLDHIEAEHIDRFNQAKKHYLSGDGQQARKILREMNGGGSREIELLADAASEAVGRGTFDRFEFIGLQKPDILEYLDPADLGLPSSWSDLMAEYRRNHPGHMNGSAYKQWLKGRGMKTDEATVRAAARRLDDLSDLSAVLQ